MTGVLGLPRLVLLHILSFLHECIKTALGALGTYGGLMAAQLLVACIWFILVLENIGSLAVS
jgi:hypothetical protein